MSEEKGKQLPCSDEKVCLEVSDMHRNANKNDKHGTPQQDCREGTDDSQTVVENNSDINVTHTEKNSIEVINFKQVKKHRKVHFEANQNKLSTNNETIYLKPERISSLSESIICIPNDINSEKCGSKFNNEIVTKGLSSPTSVDSDQESFCCGSLSESGVASAKFSMLISLVLLLISVQRFFKSSSGEDETNTKMLLFCAGVYALCYLHCARKLICGIEKDVREKFIAWIGFSVLSALLLFSGAIYVVIISWDELKNIRNEPVAGCQTIAEAFFLVLIGCILIYCTRIVLLLWNSLHVEENSSKGSCLHFTCHFCNSCALSFNSFSRAVSH